MQNNERRTVYNAIPLFSLILWQLVAKHSNIHAFVIPPNVVNRQSSQIILGADQDAVRAGSDGYSVLRQPVGKNWDPNVDPNFNVPTTLEQENERVQDQEWWVNKKTQTTTTSTKASTTATSSNNSTADGTVITKPEDLDLYQRTLDTLDFPFVLKALEQECTTVPAKHMVRQTTTHKGQRSRKNIPKGTDIAYRPVIAETSRETQERYQAVQEMEWLLESQRLNGYTYKTRRGYQESLAGRPPPLGGHRFDLDRILSIIDEGKVLEGEDIFEVASMLNVMENVQRWSDALSRVDELEFVELPRIVSCVTVNETLQALLNNAFDQDGRLSGTTFPTIGRLRARIRSLKASVMDKLQGLLALPSIKDKLTLESGGPMYSEITGGRLVLPVDSKHASSVGIVHDSSRSGKTVYVEPTELVGPTNELRQTEGELRAEEARVWRSLTAQILQNRVPLEASVAAIGQLDLSLARLLLGRRLNGAIPQVGNDGVISLRNTKHPVLTLRQVEKIVGSDIDIGADGNQGLVLTGPNAGGKTVILKLIGLVAYMSRCGIPVPADASASPRVDFFDPILADIGDLQSVGGDLSTFSGHMLVCREVLANAKRNSLVLMDEVGSGTDPNQGVAIAQALLEALVDTGARVAITTHYTQLKQLAASDDRFAVASMQFLNGRPTYKLLPGTIGESFALSVAERLNLPKSVIERATELLDSETRQMGDLIRELEDQKALVDQQALDLEEKRKEMARLEFKMKEEQIRLEKKQLNARREEARKFAKILEEKEQVLEDILEKLKTDPSRKVIAKSWDDIKFVKRDALNEAENIPSVLARKKKAEAATEDTLAELVPLDELREPPTLNVGDTLVVCKIGPLFGRHGTVNKVLGTNRVELRVNNMNIAFKFGELAFPHETFRPKSSNNNQRSSISKAAEKALEAESDVGTGHVVVAPSSSSTVAMRTASNTIDVRGCNLEEAKEKIKDKFSSCLINNRPVVYILHGHGTGGVLKTKIRGWLKSERQLVKKFQPAEMADGGDAFTRVELR